MFAQAILHHAKQKAKGAINKGAADINRWQSDFVCEMKRRPHQMSLARWTIGVLEYSLKMVLLCIALGYESALEAVKIDKKPLTPGLFV